MVWTLVFILNEMWSVGGFGLRFDMNGLVFVKIILADVRE